jgi:hypothetical protein
VTSSRRSVGIVALVPMVGMAYFACFAGALVFRSMVGGAPLASYQLFFIPLAVFSALAATAIWWRPQVGYWAAAGMSLALIAIFFLTKDGNDVVTVLSNPGRNVVQTVFYATSVPQFFSTLIFSAIGLSSVVRKSPRPDDERVGPKEELRDQNRDEIT